MCNNVCIYIHMCIYVGFLVLCVRIKIAGFTTHISSSQESDQALDLRFRWPSTLDVQVWAHIWPADRYQAALLCEAGRVSLLVLNVGNFREWSMSSLVIIPATPSNPSIPYVKRTSKFLLSWSDVDLRFEKEMVWDLGEMSGDTFVAKSHKAWRLEAWGIRRLGAIPNSAVFKSLCYPPVFWWIDRDFHDGWR